MSWICILISPTMDVENRSGQVSSSILSKFGTFSVNLFKFLCRMVRYGSDFIFVISLRSNDHNNIAYMLLRILLKKY